MTAKSSETAQSLIIVESPAKAKTIGKYVGKNFNVCASVGHVLDLPKSELGVDIENDFEPKYEIIKGKQKYITALKKACKDATTIYLAPDPDREGEAIAWHIQQSLNSLAKKKKFYRVLFNEITKTAIETALKVPGALDQAKYEAQQTRRILDRLVGYKLSPLLWEKIRRGLSAGRVQSVALRLVCDREREIEAFTPEEYWSIEVTLAEKGQEQTFVAKLVEINGEKAKIANETEASAIKSELQQQRFTVSKIEEKSRSRNPFPPFITSRMQQEAFRKYRFSAKKTMMLAQHLYEGVELGEEGPVGLITYMRTDSVRVAPTALQEAQEFILKKHGKAYTLEKPRLFKVKKGAQDAHEAIRPTSLKHTPERVKTYLDRDHFRLYELIWNRFVASQMTSARYKQKSIHITAGDYLLRVSGSTLVFDGFLLLYDESKDDGNGEDKNGSTLPNISEGAELDLHEVEPKQHFTMPPPRYSESTLIRELEDKGVGRPSTYASILSNIQGKDYTTKEGLYLKPSQLGRLVTELLVENFPHIIDVSFTANMEDQLDSVEAGKVNWKSLLREFYSTFAVDLDKAKKEMRNIKREEEPTDISCEKCGQGMVIKWGKNGYFLACSGYPDCKNTKEFRRNSEGGIEIVADEKTDVRCDDCSSPMVIKQGRFGRFLACSRYPECRGTKSLPTGVACPQKECSGELVEKRSRNGRTFYGCSRYPDCTFALWNRPVDKPCPLCEAPFLIEKILKAGHFIQCHTKGCDHQETVES